MLLRIPLLFAVTLLLSSCSPPPKAEIAKEPEKPVEPVAARYAFHQTFLTARSWAADAQGLRMTNLRVNGVPEQPGKSGAWEVTFVSPSKATMRSYTYSVVEDGNIHKDVFAGIEESYSPRAQSVPWILQAFRIDSDTALETALDKGKGKAYSEKNPEIPISFVLEQTPRHAELTWRVIWGTSSANSGFSVYVGASSGTYLETMR